MPLPLAAVISLLSHPFSQMTLSSMTFISISADCVSSNLRFPSTCIPAIFVTFAVLPSGRNVSIDCSSTLATVATPVASSPTILKLSREKFKSMATSKNGVIEGDCDGNRDKVGLVDGVEVGGKLGDKLGVCVGDDVGFSDGATLGRDDGESEGASDASFVGGVLGINVGISLGVDVGCVDGPIDGSIEGSFDGLSLGTEVG